jgi:anti-sigma factor RsiW
MSEHETVRDLLALAAAGALSPEDQLRVDRHSRACPECLRQIEVWRSYASELRSLPQPVVPNHLLQRTQARLAQEQLKVDERRSSGLVLVFLSLFGWVLSFAIWLMVRLSTGGMAIVNAEILRPDLWSLIWTVFVWASGVAAVVMLAKHQREWRRVL